MGMIDIMDAKWGDTIVSVRAFKPEVGWEGDPYQHPHRIFFSGEKFTFESFMEDKRAPEPYSTMAQFASSDNQRYRAPAIYFLPLETVEGLHDMMNTGKIEEEKDEEPTLEPVCKTGSSIILWGVVALAAAASAVLALSRF